MVAEMNGEGNEYQELIAAALRSLETKGQLPHSVRELAFSSNMTEAEALVYFADIIAVRTALIDQALVLLADAIRAAVVQADAQDPVAQLKALGCGYFGWGANNLALFGLLANGFLNPANASGSKLEQYRHSIRDLVAKKFREAMQIGRLAPDSDLEILMANSHCITLGISSMLTLNQRDAWYEGDIQNVEKLAHEMICLYFDQIFSAADGTGDEGISSPD